LLFGKVWFSPTFIPNNFTGVNHVFDIAIFALLSYIIWHQIGTELLSWLIARTVQRPPKMKPEEGLKVAFITTYVPASEPPELLRAALPAMVAADYPHDTWLLDEGDDPEAKRICAELGVHHFTRKDIAKYNTGHGGIFANKTKGGNHNAWYDAHGKKYDVVAQIDTDFVPRKDFLTKTLGYFRDPTVAFVGTPQVYGNGKESWIAQGAAEQTFSFYGPILQGLFGKEMTLLIGANHIIRVKALKNVNLYSAHLTEDLLTGMKLHANKWRSVYVPEALAVGEGPTTWQAYFNQQMRWAFGCMDIYLRQSVRLLPRMRRNNAFRYFLLQQHYFSGIAMVIGIALLTLYSFFGVSPTDMTLRALLLFYVPLVVWQTVIGLWLQRFNINPQTERGMMLKGKLISIAAWPIYFLAFVGVVRGKRMVFKVTPKGTKTAAITRTPLALFKPHFILGATTAVDVAAALAYHHTALIMIFWAALNTVLMFGLALHEQLRRAYTFATKPIYVRSLFKSVPNASAQ
jgi:cellulose synthase/poly-beta-1,6-N-acetylglucosamine synthase-like glycosyltransferase